MSIDREARRYIDSALQFTSGVTFPRTSTLVSVRNRLRTAQSLLTTSKTPGSRRALVYVERALTLLDPIEATRLRQELWQALIALTPGMVLADVPVGIAGLGATPPPGLIPPTPDAPTTPDTPAAPPAPKKSISGFGLLAILGGALALVYFARRRI
jgi:hypothetical protein